MSANDITPGPFRIRSESPLPAHPDRFCRADLKYKHQAQGIWTSQTPFAVRVEAQPPPSDKTNRQGRVLGFACGPHQPCRFVLSRPLRVRHVADLQEQAASPSDLQITSDFPVRKRGQTKQAGPWMRSAGCQNRKEFGAIGKTMCRLTKRPVARWGGFEPPTP